MAHVVEPLRGPMLDVRENLTKKWVNTNSPNYSFFLTSSPHCQQVPCTFCMQACGPLLHLYCRRKNQSLLWPLFTQTTLWVYTILRGVLSVFKWTLSQPQAWDHICDRNLFSFWKLLLKLGDFSKENRRLKNYCAIEEKYRLKGIHAPLAKNRTITK